MALACSVTPNNSNTHGATLRPNLVKTPTATDGSRGQKVQQWFDTTAFVAPAPFTYGNAPRTIGSVRSDGIKNYDMTLAKWFPLKGEAFRMQLRMDAFNLFNRTQFNFPNTTLGDPTFGTVSSVGAPPRFDDGSSKSSLDPREPISGWILKFDWLGKPGWRWVFILEAVPAILLGLITLLIVTDRPEQATWLKPVERDWVCRELQAEKWQKPSLGKITTWQALRQHQRAYIGHDDVPGQYRDHGILSLAPYHGLQSLWSAPISLSSCFWTSLRSGRSLSTVLRLDVRSDGRTLPAHCTSDDSRGSYLPYYHTEESLLWLAAFLAVRLERRDLCAR
jgi:MFS family permease